MRDRGAAGAFNHRPEGLTDRHILNPPVGDDRFYAAVPELIQRIRSTKGVAKDTSIDFDIDCYCFVVVPPFKEVSVFKVYALLIYCTCLSSLCRLILVHMSIFLLVQCVFFLVLENFEHFML